jgi:HEPN domain-containing protein
MLKKMNREVIMGNTIRYWLASAEEDIKTAEVLLENSRLLPALFYCHLVLEKGLKGAFVKSKGENVPKTHNLLYLAESSKLPFGSEELEFFGVLMTYQITGRYPDTFDIEPEFNRVEEYFGKTKEIFAWIRKQL